MLAKLNAYGVSTNASSLLLSYFENRQQRVKLGDVKSGWLKLEKGVPQGSIMGPLPYNIFANDSVMFNLRCSAEVMLSYFENNYMQANPAKFQLLTLEDAFYTSGLEVV